jgi:hypothetical protein
VISIASQSFGLGQLDPTVERNPGQYLTVNKVPQAATNLPDAVTGLVPVLRDPLDEGPEIIPERRRIVPSRFAGEVERVEDLAVDVELHLVDGPVSYPYRPGSAISLQMVECLLGYLALGADRVENLYPGLFHLDRAYDPLEESVVLNDVAGKPEGVEGE